jgi:hypothetical protein
MDAKKIANNILEFMFDPTKIPVKNRLYFRPEEVLRNESFDAAKANAQEAYGEQKHNSDFYPGQNRKQTQREAALMDRKTLIASMDVLSQQFGESDPIGKDLRTMAYAVSKMSDEQFDARTVEAKKKIEFVECPKCGNKKVMKQTGYCLKCGKKGIGKDKKKDDKKANEEFWSKEAAEAVKKALLSDVCGMDEEPEDKKEPETEYQEPEEKKEKDAGKAPKTEYPDEEKKEKDAGKAPKTEYPDEEKKEKDAGKAPECPPEEEKEKDAAKAPKTDYPEEEKKEAAKKDDEKDEKDAAKKVDEDEEVEAAKKDDEDEEVDAAKKEKEEKKEVDTGILSYEGIEMAAGLVDEAELTAAEKAQLDQLFQ